MNKDIKFCKIQLKTCKEGMKSFVYEDTYITDPTLDETGRYPVDPKKYYNLTDSQVEEMRKVNLPILEKDTDNYKEITGSKIWLTI